MKIFSYFMVLKHHNCRITLKSNLNALFVKTEGKVMMKMFSFVNSLFY